MAEHWVEFVQRRNAFLNFRQRHADFAGHLFHVGFGVRQEFVERRIQQTNGHRFAVHGGKDPFEIGSLMRQQFQDRSVTIFVCFSQNESANIGDTITLEEHVLGSAKSDSFSTERQGGFGVFGGIGVGANVDLTILVGPARYGLVHLVDPVPLRCRVAFDQRSNNGRRSGWDFAFVDFSSRTVERNHVAFCKGLVADRYLARGVVDFQLARTTDTALAPTTSNNRRVRCHSACRCQNSLGSTHSANVLGRGLVPNKDQFLFGIRLFQLFRFLRIQNDFAVRRTRSGRQTGYERSLFRFFGSIENWEQQLFEIASVDCHHSRLRIQQFWQFVARDDVFSSCHFNCPANARDTNTLCISRLQHVQLALLDRELNVLRVFVMLFEHRHRFQQFLASGD